MSQSVEETVCLSVAPIQPTVVTENSTENPTNEAQKVVTELLPVKTPQNVIMEETVETTIEDPNAEYYVVVQEGQSSSGHNTDVSGAHVVEPGGGYTSTSSAGSQQYIIDNSSGHSRKKLAKLDTFDDLGVGSTVTATSNDDGTVTLHGPLPQGMKMRRSRVFGTARCPECGQTFVNAARLERHLAVHQVFGSYLCPLCGKTYKYEYNLFYHWRRTCRDLNELMSQDERKTIDVNGLRQLVDEVAAKKTELGTLAYPFRHMSSGPNSEHPPPRVQIPLSRRGEACPECGVVVLASHMDKHMAIHRGEEAVDTKGVAGGFFCDLCGLMFRQHFNLIKHWRTNCPEIQMQLDPDVDLTMDDETLKQLVEELLRKKGIEEAEAQLQAEEALNAARTIGAEEERSRHEVQAQQQRKAVKSTSPVSSTATGIGSNAPVPSTETAPSTASTARSETAGTASCSATGEGKVSPKKESILSKIRDMSTRAEPIVQEHVDVPDSDEVDVTTVIADGRNLIDSWRRRREERTDWSDNGDGASYVEELEDDGSSEGGLERYAATPPPDVTSVNVRAKWSMIGGPVQCPECFRSFANAGRLERHLSGFHASYGTHHCVLCGNRFKYDYNLLYHYRRSCPYTKAFMERDVREQMDAPSLRQMVRNLAQKEVRLTAHVAPPPKLSSQSEMPRPRLAMRYPSNQPPAHLLMPRPNMPEGRTCPVCGIVFYGNQGLQRHMQATHPVEWEEWKAQGGVQIELTPQVKSSRKRPEEQSMDKNITLQSVTKGPPPRVPGKGVMAERSSGLRKSKLPLAFESIDTQKDPGKEAAEIDPTLESSIATFLSEMKHEASSGNSQVFRAGYKRGESLDCSATVGPPEKQKRPQKVIYLPIEPRQHILGVQSTPDASCSMDNLGRQTMNVGHKMPEEFMEITVDNTVQTVNLASEKMEPKFGESVLHGPEIVTADFEEELDVDGEAMGEVLMQMSSKLTPTKRPSRRQNQGSGSTPKKTPTLKKEKEPPTCLLCFKTFLTNAHLMKHAKTHREEGQTPKEETTVCRLCGMKFREEYNLITHWRSERCTKIGAFVTEKKQLEKMDGEQLKIFVQKALEKSLDSGLQQNVEFSEEYQGVAEMVSPVNTGKHAGRNCTSTSRESDRNTPKRNCEGIGDSKINAMNIGGNSVIEDIGNSEKTVNKNLWKKAGLVGEKLKPDNLNSGRITRGKAKEMVDNMEVD